jgi:hypothetical protein
MGLRIAMQEQQWRPAAADAREYLRIAGIDAMLAGIGNEIRHRQRSSKTGFRFLLGRTGLGDTILNGVANVNPLPSGHPGEVKSQRRKGFAPDQYAGTDSSIFRE